jgi:hypothetical protein
MQCFWWSSDLYRKPIFDTTGKNQLYGTESIDLLNGICNQTEAEDVNYLWY